MKVLVVIDMQNDFVNGALGTPEAQAIVPLVKQRAEQADFVIFTRDTHSADYLQTQEGKNLPVEHCIEGTHGWEIIDELKPYVKTVVDKPSFGSLELPDIIPNADEIELCGLCTDICVVSNAAILKAAFPETPLTVNANLCAGVTPETHKAALETMKMFHINVVE